MSVSHGYHVWILIIKAKEGLKISSGKHTYIHAKEGTLVDYNHKGLYILK